jgi:ubiquinone/menaquinone biosynthesis C-methylase UbiE
VRRDYFKLCHQSVARQARVFVEPYRVLKSGGRLGYNRSIEARMALHQLTISLTTSLTPELSLVGGKAASLIRLKQAGFQVPDGFVLTTAFFAPWADKVKSLSEWQSARASVTCHITCHATRYVTNHTIGWGTGTATRPKAGW